MYFWTKYGKKFGTAMICDGGDLTMNTEDPESSALDGRF
jgi:hypothetical protein